MPSAEIVKIALAEASLLEFIKQAWHILEPTTVFQSGWHLEAICDHLEAATNRQIRNLIINMPPRHMKSLAVSVFWPCWVWINDPSSRWLFSSYAQELSTRDSLKCRRLISSEWYRKRWGHKFHLTGDQNQKTRFENDKTGYRLATSVSGLVTGEGGDFIVCDDPHNVKQAESEAVRKGTLRWWDESMSTRGNNPKTVVKVVDM
ncbi:MAG: terminase, partial [Candidatus Scalindua sp.]|nr:terminase [Candidatus Scalindua sp.]